MICGGKEHVLKSQLRNFSGGPMVKNLPSNAGDAGSISGQGTKIPQAAGQLSPCATTTEFARLNERACVPQTTEPMEPAPQLERGPGAARKRSCVPPLRPDTAKNKN